MGKTRNNYLVQEHFEDEDATIYDCEYASYPDEIDDSYDDMCCPFECDEGRLNDVQVSFVVKEEKGKQEVKEWDGKVVKGIPSLYELALDALPSKTRMQLAKFTLPRPIG
jgi:hypothetical protein